MTSVSPAVTSSVQSYQPQLSARRSVRDPDGDGDNDATESAAAKAQEARKSVNPNLGNNLNVVA